MSKVISMMNQKGGSGKTTSSQHLAIAKASKGNKVLFIDADPQGTAIKFFARNHMEFPNGYDGVIDVIAANKDNILNVLDNYGTTYDYIFIDTAPRLGVEMSMIIEASDLVVISCQPTMKDIEASEEIVAQIKRSNHPNSRFLVSRKKHNVSDQSARNEMEQMGIKVFVNHITEYSAYDKADRKGVGIIHMDGEYNAHKAAADIHRLTEEIEMVI